MFQKIVQDRDENAQPLKSIVHTCEIPILIVPFYFPFTSMSATIQYFPKAIPCGDHLKIDIESKEKETGIFKEGYQGQPNKEKK